MPYPPYSPYLSLSDFFVSLDEKIPQSTTFCTLEEVKQKMVEALKGIKTVLSSGKKVLKCMLHQMESIFKVTKVQTWKNKYTIFYK